MHKKILGFFILLTLIPAALVLAAIYQAKKRTAVQPVIITNQFDLTASDSGRTFSYPITSRFQIILDKAAFPENDFKVVCQPNDALGPISNLPAVQPTQFVIRYEAVKAGTCEISDKNFGVNIIVVK